MGKIYTFEEVNEKHLQINRESLWHIEPEFRSDATVELVESMGTEDSIVTAARVSNDSEAKYHTPAANKGLLRALMRDRHGVPFEHVVLEWYLEVPIFISRQIVKTRISSVNESSGRYNSAIPEFYIPPVQRPLVQVGKTMAYEFMHSETDEDYAEQRDELVGSIEYSNRQWWRQYCQRREDGVAKEVARIDAPTNMYSHMRVQWNLRTTLNFISLRHYDADAVHPSHAQWEIDYLVAQQMADVLAEKYPNVWGAFKEFGMERI